MPSLDSADAAELAGILQFLTEWLARDPDRLGQYLQDFVGHPAYGIVVELADLSEVTASQALRSLASCR